MNGTIERTANSRIRGSGPLRLLRDPVTWRAALYLLVGFGFGLAAFVVLVTGLAVALGTTVIWVGVPLFVLLMLVWRGAAMLERRLMLAVFGVEIASPYRALPEGGLLRKWRAMLADPATWKDLGYLFLLFPITLVEFCVSVTLWMVVFFHLTLPVNVSVFGGQLNYGNYVVDTLPEALLWVPVGLMGLLVAPYVVRGMGAAHVAIAKVLLGPNETQELKARAAHLQASRARGVDAAEAERRRIERDLHDGAQQQLLAVAMDLGRARAKLEDDPVAARQLLEQAHAGAKEAIVELRNLARGIYPAILTDRGLDPALSGLAARAPVPVAVEVDLDDRPPAAVESIAYFVVAESLANVAKYARATRVAVRVFRDGPRVVVEVSDNGVGGAVAAPGGGLAGLADRAATIDGILTVNSPPGGPTVVRADLPSVW